METKKIELRKCDCSSEDSPVLYCEGIATQYIEEDGTVSPMYWRSKDGYVVECTECGAITSHFVTPEEAVKAWNARRLEYQGDL